VLNVLDVVLAVAAFLLGQKVIQNRRMQVILTAVAAAEHLIDRAAYNDDQLNSDRVALAVAVLERIDPKLDPKTVQADIEKVLAVIHKHANAVAPPVEPQASQPKAS
jgi:hypothetical protein